MGKFRFALILAASAAMQLAPMSQPAAAEDAPGLKDVPYDFVPLWTGFYAGVNGGGVLGNTGLHDKFDYNGDPEWKTSASGVGYMGGVQTGYNFQYGHLVFGLEGDGGYLSLSAAKSKHYTQSSCAATYTDKDGKNPYKQTYSGGAAALCTVDAKYSTSSDLYGDLTGRLGYLAGRTLFYVKGGAAVLDSDFKENYAGQNCLSLKWCGSGAASPFNFDHSSMLLGWTAGAGVEYALTTSWSFKAEYQHFDFGNVSYTNNPAPYVIPCSSCDHTGGHYTSTLSGKSDLSLTADTVKLGINYHLDNEAELK